MAYENLNQMFWEVPTSTRPATLAEMARDNALDLLNNCEPENHQLHADFIKAHVDDLDAVNNYCVQELTALDAKDYGRMVRDLVL